MTFEACITMLGGVLGVLISIFKYIIAHLFFCVKFFSCSKLCRNVDFALYYRSTKLASSANVHTFCKKVILHPQNHRCLLVNFFPKPLTKIGEKI